MRLYTDRVYEEIINNLHELGKNANEKQLDILQKIGELLYYGEEI